MILVALVFVALCAASLAAGVRTWIGWLNFFGLQWLGIRLAGEREYRDGPLIALHVLGPVLPLTGWWSSYVPAPRMRRLWTR